MAEAVSRYHFVPLFYLSFSNRKKSACYKAGAFLLPEALRPGRFFAANPVGFGLGN